MTTQEKQEIKDDIEKYERDTNHSFHTAHLWNRRGGYSHIVTAKDVGK